MQPFTIPGEAEAAGYWDHLKDPSVKPRIYKMFDDVYFIRVEELPLQYLRKYNRALCVDRSEELGRLLPLLIPGIKTVVFQDQHAFFTLKRRRRPHSNLRSDPTPLNIRHRFLRLCATTVPCRILAKMYFQVFGLLHFPIDIIEDNRRIHNIYQMIKWVADGGNELVIDEHTRAPPMASYETDDIQRLLPIVVPVADWPQYIESPGLDGNDPPAMVRSREASMEPGLVDMKIDLGITVNLTASSPQLSQEQYSDNQSTQMGRLMHIDFDDDTEADADALVEQTSSIISPSSQRLSIKERCPALAIEAAGRASSQNDRNHDRSPAITAVSSSSYTATNPSSKRKRWSKGQETNADDFEPRPEANSRSTSPTVLPSFAEARSLKRVVVESQLSHARQTPSPRVDASTNDVTTMKPPQTCKPKIMPLQMRKPKTTILSQHLTVEQVEQLGRVDHITNPVTMERIMQCFEDTHYIMVSYLPRHYLEKYGRVLQYDMGARLTTLVSSLSSGQIHSVNFGPSSFFTLAERPPLVHLTKHEPIPYRVLRDRAFRLCSSPVTHTVLKEMYENVYGSLPRFPLLDTVGSENIVNWKKTVEQVVAELRGKDLREVRAKGLRIDEDQLEAELVPLIEKIEVDEEEEIEIDKETNEKEERKKERKGEKEEKENINDVDSVVVKTEDMVRVHKKLKPTSFSTVEGLSSTTALEPLSSRDGQFNPASNHIGSAALEEKLFESPTRSPPAFMSNNLSSGPASSLSPVQNVRKRTAVSPSSTAKSVFSSDRARDKSITRKNRDGCIPMDMDVDNVDDYGAKTISAVQITGDRIPSASASVTAKVKRDQAKADCFSSTNGAEMVKITSGKDNHNDTSNGSAVVESPTNRKLEIIHGVTLKQWRMLELMFLVNNVRPRPGVIAPRWRVD